MTMTTIMMMMLLKKLLIITKNGGSIAEVTDVYKRQLHHRADQFLKEDDNCLYNIHLLLTRSTGLVNLVRAHDNIPSS